MKIDPSDQINTMKARPSLNGSGSGKANWIAYADRLEEANVSLGDLINEQAEVIKDRDAEIARLQKQIATRKPKGGRPRTSQATIDRIEHSLRQGFPMRHIGKQFQVSPMTVSRIKKDMQARDSQSS
jgi:hypothetical protein